MEDDKLSLCSTVTKNTDSRVRLRLNFDCATYQLRDREHTIYFSVLPITPALMMEITTLTHCLQL